MNEIYLKAGEILPQRIACIIGIKDVQRPEYITSRAAYNAMNTLSIAVPELQKTDLVTVESEYLLFGRIVKVGANIVDWNTPNICFN